MANPRECQKLMVLRCGEGVLCSSEGVLCSDKGVLRSGELERIPKFGSLFAMMKDASQLRISSLR